MFSLGTLRLAVSVSSHPSLSLQPCAEMATPHNGELAPQDPLEFGGSTLTYRTTRHFALY